MSLFYQTDEGTAHGDDVIVRMRREDDHPLRERGGGDGTCGIVCVRFPSRPARDGVLQVVEHVDIDLVVCPFLFEELPEGILYVVLVRQLENRLVYGLAEPYHGFPDEFRCPLARPDKPWSHDAGQQAGRVVVGVERDVFMLLQERCRAGRGDRPFDDVLDGPGLVLAPGHQDDFLCAHHRGYADRNGGLWRVGYVAVEIARLRLPRLV